MNKESILGVNVCVTEYSSLELNIEEDIKSGRQSFIVAVNPEKISKALKDEGLKSIINNAEYPIADGIGVVYASKLNKGKIKKRITGIDSMNMLLELSDRNKYKVFFFGSKENVLEETTSIIKGKYHNLEIVGAHNGYESREKLVEDINKSGAQIIFVALGSPMQEYWISENRKNLNVNVLQGVGGSFDVISNRIKRAPIWMQNFGLEWFYRLMKEPKRIFRQLSLFSFFYSVLRTKNDHEEN